MRRRAWGAAFVAALVSTTIGVAHAEVSTSIGPTGTAIDGTVRMVVGVACDPVGGNPYPLEAFVTLSQNDESAFGDGFFGPICDGVNRRYTVTVFPYEGEFHKGGAFASTYVLICDEEDSVCESGGTTGTVRLRAPG